MQSDPRSQSLTFSGSRWDLAVMLLRGYVLMVPTIGLNRFWLTTRKRRFYWGHTGLGGDMLEYTGDAQQLLIGFLMALAVFLPLYGLFFYLSTQSVEIVITGYGLVAILVWFLYGYAQYRARDFRLSRTLWRGIRFDQGGSAWRYGLRRFFWSLLNVATLGLAYPFMAASLWRYRYANSFYGDRQFRFAGSWRQLALPYYLTWVAVAVMALVALVMADEAKLFEEPLAADASAYGNLLLLALVGLVLTTFYRAAEMTRMFSAVQLGDARLTLRLSALRLLAQYLLFALALGAAYLVLALGGFIVLGLVAAEAFSGGGFDLDVLMASIQSSVVTLLAIVTGYLLVLAAFIFVSELVLGYGFWWLVARGASVSGLDSLDDVKARAEDKALAGEGLADALNVGGY
ncbi:DUF898 family protein [Devosia faecipullorum]|uniref:DUF898 family protein n=1 Tax=Devosia faecipullorum TaxID=2755039 RepID=UPI00187B4AB5|nr:DUF898 family protein [Devosia faecipullorum]MBE7733956.1 DUF898 family protein [Devosia faecipullorum]